MSICIIDETELVNKYLGIRYEHRGRSREHGLDCWGLVCLVYMDCFNISVTDVENYERNFALYGKNYFEEHIDVRWREITVPEPLAVVLFSNMRGIIDHAGICLSQNKFMQCDRHGVTVARLLDDTFKDRPKRFYKYVHNHN